MLLFFKRIINYTWKKFLYFFSNNFLKNKVSCLINYFVNKKTDSFILALTIWSLISTLYLLKIFKFRTIIAEGSYKFFVILYCLSLFLVLFMIFIVVFNVFFKINILDDNNSSDRKINEIIKPESINMNTIKPLIKIHNESNVHSFCKLILKELINYMEGGAGIFYLKENGKFNLISCYAIPKKNIAESFSEGEGIIGQAVLDKRIVLFRNIENKYLTIKSGTGFINPTSIIIIPFVNGDIVYGVAEIALIKTINENQISVVRCFVNNASNHLRNIIKNK